MRRLLGLSASTILILLLHGCAGEKEEIWAFNPFSNFCGKMIDSYDGPLATYPSCEECELANLALIAPEDLNCVNPTIGTGGGGTGGGGTGPTGNDRFNAMIWISSGYTNPYSTITNVRVRVFKGYVNTPSAAAGKPVLADVYLDYEGNRYGGCASATASFPTSTSAPNTRFIPDLEYGESYSTLTTYTLNGNDQWTGSAGWRVNSPNSCINNAGFHWINPSF